MVSKLCWVHVRVIGLVWRGRQAWDDNEKGENDAGNGEDNEEEEERSPYVVKMTGFAHTAHVWG